MPGATPSRSRVLRDRRCARTTETLPAHSPVVGEMVAVRSRHLLVEDAVPQAESGHSSSVRLSRADDDAQGQTLDVFWDEMTSTAQFSRRNANCNLRSEPAKRSYDIIKADLRCSESGSVGPPSGPPGEDVPPPGDGGAALGGRQGSALARREARTRCEQSVVVLWTRESSG